MFVVTTTFGSSAVDRSATRTVEGWMDKRGIAMLSGCVRASDNVAHVRVR